MTGSVLIIGGGVMGASTAWHLARRGLDVTVLEARSIAAAASGASAGGVRQQNRDPREMPLAIAAFARWEHLESELEAELEYYRNGHLTVFENAADLSMARRRVAEQRSLGLEIELLEGDALAARAPGLSPCVMAGTYVPNDGHANPTLTTKAFAAAVIRAGAEVRESVPVRSLRVVGPRVVGVETASGPLAADHVVLAAGAWTRDLLAPLGISLPLTAHGFQMILTKPRPLALRQVIGSYDRALSLKQVRGGGYLIGGGWPGDIDMDAGVGRTRSENISGSYATAAAVFPDVAQAPVDRAWVGIEAVTPDEVPVIGPAPGIDGLTVAAGFSGHGFALSPIIGQLVSEAIVDGAPSLPLDAFALDRFDGVSASDPVQPSAG